MAFFEWLEHSAFSMWVKDPETLLGYNLYLSSHAVGMAFLVGLSSAISLRILGFAPRVPLAPLAKFFPFMYAGFWLNALSGIVLFVIYPLMPLRNPGFYVKLGLIALAVAIIRQIRRQVFGNPACQSVEPVPRNGRALAAALLLIWIGVITAGRLMAYHGIANVEWQVTMAMLTVAPAMALAGWLVYRWFLKPRSQAALHG